jgi:predicted nucleic-acid-binding Zn-ribbon protein
MRSLREGVCPKCGSRAIVPNAETIGGNALAVRIYEKAGIVLRGMRTFPVKAWVCTQCGYTEFYVSAPTELGRSYRRSLAAANS